MPSVEKAVRRRSHMPLDDQPVIIDDEPSPEEEKLEET